MMNMKRHTCLGRGLVTIVVAALLFAVGSVGSAEEVLLFDDFTETGPIDTHTTWKITQGKAVPYCENSILSMRSVYFHSQKVFSEPISVRFEKVVLAQPHSRSENNNLGINISTAGGYPDNILCFRFAPNMGNIYALRRFQKKEYARPYTISGWGTFMEKIATREDGSSIEYDLRIDWWPGELVRYYVNDKLVAEYSDHVMATPSPVGVKDPSACFSIGSIKVTRITKSAQEILEETAIARAKEAARKVREKAMKARVNARIQATAVEKLTYIDLINRLTDLERLAILPAPGEKCAQWSSYDRTSEYDDTSGKYINWSFNEDGTGIIRGEDGKLVFAEMEGPGVIWRIWSAKAGSGRVKIYLDGNNKPAVDLPFEGYFNRKNEPFTRSALVHRTADGLNCYVPIPYQKSCKITAEEENWGRYYHITYTTYPKGTILPTFKRDFSVAESIALDKANEILNSCGIDPAGKRRGEVTEQKTVTIAPGHTSTVMQLNGPRAITALKIKMRLPESPQDYNVLRELVLRISWDNEPQPSVWAPLGDFFGTAPGMNKYKSLPMGMTEDGFYSYWYMPFGEAALIELINDGSEERTVTFTITHAPLSRPIKGYGRFHVKWHRDAFLPVEIERRVIDWTLLKTQGKGRYCGVMLHVWNPKGIWWGEGDEKFFIDGEKFPSTFGTGSEDYFGYAWASSRLFNNSYHNQTFNMNTGNCEGHISVNRWHITDNVPFQKTFEGAIEKYFSNDRPTLYAGTVYWYLAPGGTDRYQTVPVKERIGYWILPGLITLEGERLKILGKTRGNAMRQGMSGFGTGWSGDAHLWWIDANSGDTLDLSMPVEKTGRYRLRMQLTKAGDYGIVQLYLDGNKLGNPIDLYNHGVVPTGVLDMGIHELDKGEHKLRVEIVGANEKAAKSYMFGIDYLQLEMVK